MFQTGVRQDDFGRCLYDFEEEEEELSKAMNQFFVPTQFSYRYLLHYANAHCCYFLYESLADAFMLLINVMQGSFVSAHQFGLNGVQGFYGIAQFNQVCNINCMLQRILNYYTLQQPFHNSSQLSQPGDFAHLFGAAVV
ncbi:hypothetical protein B296_00030025 [Ensete ventricosum]|uniref:Uncharacterized protein n=1 Tax=Ensete ventricosum TaxID=4639 RepID=A0A426XCH0_ENSVE|nr:hypothetical protein B296_00030025 [Ensete ventricosum]